MRARWGICLLLAACLSIGWLAALWRVPTDTLVGSARFQENGYLVLAAAPFGAAWAEQGQSTYRAILRVDAHNMDGWLNAPAPNGWETGTSHQYLVERRDGGGKRVITVTLQNPQGLLPQGVWALLQAASYSLMGVLIARQKRHPLIVAPLILGACAAWLMLGWHMFGVPFSYVALQLPLLGQWTLNALAQTLLLGAAVHAAVVFPQPLAKDRRWLPALYLLYPLGCLLIALWPDTPESKWTALWHWEQQIAVAMKAAAYLLWAVQYRRASVRQRGQLHWWLVATTAYDLFFLMRLFSAQDDLLIPHLLLGALLPVAYLLAVHPDRWWRWRLEGSSGFVHGIANTLTLALFLCGLGLAASVFFSTENQARLPLVTLGLAVGFALTTVPLANLLREQFDSWFQGTRSAQRALLHEFTARVSAQITLGEVADAFNEAVEQGVRPAEQALWLWDEEAQVLQTWASDRCFIVLPGGIAERLIRSGGFTPVAQFPEWEAAQRYHGIVPLVVSKQLIGVCAIGRRNDGRAYSAEGLRFLETLSRPATLALRNAQLVAQLEAKILALRQAYQQLIAAQEQERSRLATELHDETLQQLAHVNLLAGGLRYRLPDETQLGELQNVLGATERGLRNILRGVHPAVLTNLGLIPALRSWLPQRDHVQIELITEGFQQRLPDPALELTLYRLCQEGVNNALGHARAQHIGVTLIWQENTVVLEIRDDGVGFEPAALATRNRAAQGHFGLMNLRERVDALNGQLTIHSQPRQGTLIRAILPVPG